MKSSSAKSSWIRSNPQRPSSTPIPPGPSIRAKLIKHRHTLCFFFALALVEIHDLRADRRVGIARIGTINEDGQRLITIVKLTSSGPFKLFQEISRPGIVSLIFNSISIQHSMIIDNYWGILKKWRSPDLFRFKICFRLFSPPTSLASELRNLIVVREGELLENGSFLLFFLEMKFDSRTNLWISVWVINRVSFCIDNKCPCFE